MPHVPPTLLRRACLFGLLCLLSSACRTNDATTSGPAETDTSRAEAPADTSTPPSDSAARLKNPSPAPSPGTARIRAEILSCDAVPPPMHCRIRVEEVLEYGSSTPPLSTGQRTMRLASSLLEDPGKEPLEKLGPHPFVVRHAGDQPDLEGETSEEKRPEWTLQSIEE